MNYLERSVIEETLMEDIKTPPKAKNNLNFNNSLEEIILNLRQTQQRDVKDALLANLYSTVEFLKSELCNKNNVIQDLLKSNRELQTYIINGQQEKQESSIKSENELSHMPSLPEFRTVTSLNDTLQSDEKSVVSESISQQNKDHTPIFESTWKSDEKNHLYEGDSSRVNDNINKEVITTIEDSEHYHLREEDVYDKTLHPDSQWKKGTTLIIGDSMIGGVLEKRLRNTKVRSYPGAIIEDLFYHLVPLLRKKPTNIIVHAGTNNTTIDNPELIIHKLMTLREFILSKIPDCKVVFSDIICRTDIGKAQKVASDTNKIMKSLDILLIDNGNIDENFLAKRGLHLKPHGTGRLAMNFINGIKKL